MLHSQNGYSADPALMAAFTVPTTKIRVVLRQGDTSVLLLYLLEQYHATVEPLTQADTGGYNPRSIIGTKVKSNHASGTAADARWRKHQRGKRNTFTAPQVKAVRKILAVLSGTVRWGEDYQHAPIDGMHFEIVGTPSANARVADRIRTWRDLRAAEPRPVARKAPAWPRGTPAFRQAKAPRYSPTVRAWQAQMRRGGWTIVADGRYGRKSADVAAALQHKKHLEVDRMLGPATFAAAWPA